MTAQTRDLNLQHTVMFEVACDWILFKALSQELHDQHFIQMRSVIQVSIQLCFLCTVSVTLEHDACRKSIWMLFEYSAVFTAKHLLPLSPCMTVKWLNVLLQGQPLSAIWITASPRLWWHHHAQSTQIKTHASHTYINLALHCSNSLTEAPARSGSHCLSTDQTIGGYFLLDVSCLCAKRCVLMAQTSKINGLTGFQKHELTFRENAALCLICLDWACHRRAGSLAPRFTPTTMCGLFLYSSCVLVLESCLFCCLQITTLSLFCPT